MQKFTASQLKAIDDIASENASTGKSKDVAKQEMFSKMSYSDSEKLKPKS